MLDVLHSGRVGRRQHVASAVEPGSVLQVVSNQADRTGCVSVWVPDNSAVVTPSQL